MNMPNELTDAILYCLFSGILSAGAVTGVFLLLRVMLYVPFMQKKMARKSQGKGQLRHGAFVQISTCMVFWQRTRALVLFRLPFLGKRKGLQGTCQAYRACLPSSGQGTHGILAQESLSRCG